MAETSRDRAEDGGRRAGGWCRMLSASRALAKESTLAAGATTVRPTAGAAGPPARRPADAALRAARRLPADTHPRLCATDQGTAADVFPTWFPTSRGTSRRRFSPWFPPIGPPAPARPFTARRAAPDIPADSSTGDAPVSLLKSGAAGTGAEAGRNPSCGRAPGQGCAGPSERVNWAFPQGVSAGLPSPRRRGAA